MNYTQNEKIEQVTDTMVVVGVDIRIQLHYVRAFDSRWGELTRRVLCFRNNIEGFNTFNIWIETLKSENEKTDVTICYESTWHYWLAFAKCVKDHKNKIVMVNPFSVKKIKRFRWQQPKENRC